MMVMTLAAVHKIQLLISLLFAIVLAKIRHFDTWIALLALKCNYFVWFYSISKSHNEFKNYMKKKTQ